MQSAFFAALPPCLMQRAQCYLIRAHNGFKIKSDETVALCHSFVRLFILWHQIVQRPKYMPCLRFFNK